MSAGRLPAALEAYHRQVDVTVQWLHALTDDDFARPTVLDGWDARTLLGHVVLIHEGMQRFLDTRSAEPAVTPADYVRRYRRDVELIAASTAETTGTHAPAVLLGRLGTPVDAGTVDDRTVLAGPRGPITALDWVTTRIVDLIVHADDFSRSLPDRAPVPWHRPALAQAVRSLAEILAAQAPGRSVEVRIPPFIAVQAVPGPRHTRGTPPNVVETDGVTWLRLATGRTPFAEVVAAGAVRAAGSRSDLTEYLPVLA